MSQEKQWMSDRKTGKLNNAEHGNLKPVLDDVWPVHSAGGWPQGLSLDRGDIYEGRT